MTTLHTIKVDKNKLETFETFQLLKTYALSIFLHIAQSAL